MDKQLNWRLNKHLFQMLIVNTCFFFDSKLIHVVKGENVIGFNKKMWI
jgi:hypothetical protein